MDKNFWKAAGIRCLKTVCQTAAAALATTTLISEIDLKALLSATILAGLGSLLTSVMGGLPEVSEGDSDDDALD